MTGLPLDFEGLDPYRGKEKENIVVFNGRNCDEKQPWLFKRLEEKIEEHYPHIKARFVNTQMEGFTKEEYYDVMSRAKVVVSYALQENFGFGIAEAAYLGAMPVLPNRLVYPELYPKRCLYDTMDEHVTQVAWALDNHSSLTDEEMSGFTHGCFPLWFKDC